MIDLETLRAYLLAKKGTTEERPFGPQALVYKVIGKMFALIAWEEEPLDISLKCDPDEALFLRDIYPTVRPGYHMNKRHWNTITVDGSIPQKEFLRLIDDSYNLVVKGLTKSQRQTLQGEDQA
jgi:predicted DNA-binding protein (MmcQ/YjbR family)